MEPAERTLMPAIRTDWRHEPSTVLGGRIEHRVDELNCDSEGQDRRGCDDQRKCAPSPDDPPEYPAHQEESNHQDLNRTVGDCPSVGQRDCHPRIGATGARGSCDQKRRKRPASRQGHRTDCEDGKQDGDGGREKPC